MASCARRTVQLEEDDLPYRKGSNTSVKSEGTGTEFYNKHGLHDSHGSEGSVRPQRPISTVSNSSMRVRRLSSLTDDNTRFPKLQDCAHFHYDVVDINSLQVSLLEDENDAYHHNGDAEKKNYFFIKITSNSKTWVVRRSFQNFRMLDQKLHRCIFDRKYSHLPEIAAIDFEASTHEELCVVLGQFLTRFSTLAGSMLNCGSVLNWLEIDNRGNRLVAVDDSGINTPAIAAAHAIKRYTAQAADEISLEVGDIVSVIDMPPTDDTIWWRGKRGFEVGFFPFECVELIGDKIPASVVSNIPETPSAKALLKKHGKFMSFLRLFFNTRPERIQLKQSGIVKERVFGCDLGEHLLNSGHDVPLVLKSCADAIETHGLVDGIYRLSGITSNIQKLRNAFDEDRVPDLTSEEYLQDVHSISSLLKMYFRELPNPLLTYQLYDKFADAVRDEENKLLRIHDVVQQLPPPHYRSTEYLMRHLARVAAHGQETGMHSKNLAIVWAPNLLRSKELESGGGAAALRGVGIQAVVTEFLILYADLIFSDKMPAYHSPELRKAQKKPRPKSLAISTPTRLLTLEEARERALTNHIVKPDQKYIDVGGGPSSLPSKYHTVLDLPGYKKKGAKDSIGKGKKSPGGLKSLFSKSRTGSVRQKGRKAGVHVESLNFESSERKAITEEDVQHWKRRRIRSAKSAESLLSLPVTSRLGSPLTESLDPNRLMNILAGKENSSPSKYSRSMSIESPRSLSSTQEFSMSYPSFVLEDRNSREMAIDVNPEDIKLDVNDQGEKESTDDKIHRKQSFVRGETKRRVICHRRTPSAPTTPRHNGQDSGTSCNDAGDILGQQYPERDKSISQPVLDGALCSKPPHGAGRSSSGLRHDSESERFYVESIVPDSAFIRNSEENSSEKRKGSKTPPKDRKKLKEAKDNSPQMEGKVVRGDRGRRGSDKENISDFSIKQGSGLIAELPESPGSRRKLWTSSTSKSEDHGAVSKTYFYSRFHDYAEIDDDNIDGENQIINHGNTQNYGSDSSLRSSSENKHPSLESRRSYHVESIDSVQSESQTKTDKSNETEFQVSSRKNSRAYSSNESVSSTHSGRKYIAHEDLLAEISDLEKGLQNMQKSSKRGGRKPMTKCVSIPSDIQRSIDNIRSASGSHSDLMSSVTISELSVSQDNVSEDSLTLDRRRRSTSMDALHDESPLSRTLREINAQIDKAFKHEKTKTQSLRELQCSPQTPTGSAYELESELISYEEELAETPTGHRTFSSMRDAIESPSAYCGDTTLAGSITPTEQNQNKFVDRPVAETHVVSAPQVIRAPLRFNKGAASPIQTTQPTPTRPSPPASLDIVSSIQQSGHPVIVTEIKNSDTSFHQNVQSKTDFKLSEEDFQKILMSDPESMKQFEQSMMYSPVRSRNCSNRASVASPVEGVIPRLRSNRSSLTSPEASPIAFPRQPHNRGIGSPEVSPQSLRHHRHVSSAEASPQSARQQRILSSTESSPSSGCKYKHNQSFSSSEASPKAVRQRLSQSYSSSDSPQSNRQKLNSSLSSCEASPHSSRQKLNHSSSETSPPVGTRDKHNISFSSSTENSPQPAGRKLGQYRTSSPQFTKSSPQTRHEVKTIGSPLQDKRSVQDSPKFDNRKSSSTVSSPLSPEHKQPRWEDLACLNDSFNELDLAVFNDNWKKCLAPTGDSIRMSKNTDSREVLNAHNDFPEVGTVTDTVVLERPSITRKSIPERGKSLEIRSPEIETYDNVPEHESFRLAQEAKTSKGVQRDRPFLQRSHTAPSDTSLPQSPTAIRSVQSEFVGQASGFEPSSMSGHTSEKAFESPKSSSRQNVSLVESSNLKKSTTTPVLTRQRSFDSSYKKSIRVTSLGSSMEDYDINPQGFVREESVSSKSSSNVGRPDQGSFISMSASNQADFSSVGTSGGVLKSSSTNQSSYSVSSQHGTQSSMLIRSESQSSYSDGNQSSRAQNINQSNIANQFPQMLEEMDVNESCLGIPSHQNLSNEMKEMMQEQMKEHAGVLSPLDDIVPFAGLTSPLSRRSFFDTDHPLAGFDMESSLEIPADVQSIDLPEVHIQYLYEGPTVTATPTVLSQLGGTEIPHVHHPIDNTEEEFQNAVNDDLERNLSGLSAFLPQHVSVCEPPAQYQQTTYDQRSVTLPYNTDRGSSLHMHDTDVDNATGQENMLIITPTVAPVITDTPAPIMQDSMSSSSSSLFDSMSMSSSFTYPQSFDSRHYYSPRVNSLNIQGDLAPPPLEMIEVCKSSFVLSKASFHRKPPRDCAEPVFSFQNENIKWQYPSLAHKNSVNEDKDRITKGRQTNKKGNKDGISAERGEEKLVLELRPSLKKGVTKSEQETKKKVQSSKIQDLVDSDHGEFSGTEDEVFVDPSEVTADTTFFAAGSKYFKRRDFLSYGHFPGHEEKVTGNNKSTISQTFTFEPLTRLSLDESMMQIVAHRHENTNPPESGLVQDYHDDILNMEVGPIDKEDVRFSKAHRSSKLLSLCEKFEGGSAQSLNSDDEENTVKPKQITPPEKNIVASIRQMHESLELDKDVDGGVKTVRHRPVSHEGTKSPVEEIEYATSPVSSRDLSRFDAASSGPSLETKSKDNQTPHGKPPKHRGKPRTHSESSLSENEGIKGSPKNTRVETKPKNEGSPKGQRNSLVSPDEGSPKLTPTKSSPKGQRYSTEISPKLGRTKDSVPAVPRHSVSPQSVQSAEGSKIPVPKYTQSHKEDSKSLSNGKTAGSPKGSRNSTVSPNTDSPSRIGPKTKDSKQTVKHSENNGGHTKLNKDREFPSRVHFEVQTSETKHDFRREKKIEDSAEKKKRRGSIKELTNVFEEKIENLSKQTQSQSVKQNQSQSTAQAKLRARVRSVSPSNTSVKPSQQPLTNMRHSLELPRKETGLQSEHASKSGEGTTRPHSVRMGPKPFYGAK